MASSTASKADKDGPSGPFGPVFQIIPGVQSYDWGKTTKQGSLVAAFAESTDELQFDKQDGKPYAELWMGTHPTLPSYVIPPERAVRSTDGNEDKFISLTSYLSKHPSLIGKNVQARFSAHAEEQDQSLGELPFLFKILSIGKALSIQAHPDKELAQRLHAEKPKMYKDDNHKPEMAIALTDFRGFCGFRPLAQIIGFLDAVPEFKAVVRPSESLQGSLEQYVKSSSSSTEEEKKKLLREVFANLMNASTDIVERNVTAIAKRYGEALEKGESVEVDRDIAELVCTLNGQFPADVGVLCAFVLNVVRLTPGQAIFLKANEPHAYLDGEIVECMAASDNVVRAGLTPKARDVQVLVDMLTYDDSPSDEKRMQPTPFTPDEKSASFASYGDEKGNGVPSYEYDPPIDEFSVVRTTLQVGEAETHRAIAGPSLVIVTQGKGTLVIESAAESRFEGRKLEVSRAGQVFFVGADTKITLQSGQESAEPFISYRAFVEA